jgi:hypothetical protein
VGASTEPPANVLPAFNKNVLISLVKDKSAVDKTPTVAQWLAHLERKNISAVTLLMLHLHRLLLILGCLLRKTLGNATRGLLSRMMLATPSSMMHWWTSSPLMFKAPSLRTVVLNLQLTRIHNLGTEMEEIKAHNATFRPWFKETGTRLANQDEQLAHLHIAVQQQQQDLLAVRTEVHTSADNPHQAMQHSFGTMKSDLASELTHAVALGRGSHSPLSHKGSHSPLPHYPGH